MKKRTRRATQVLGICIAASVTTACTTGSGSGGSTAGDPVDGGTLKVALGPGITCLDPQQTISLDARSVGRAVADSLLDLDPKTGELKPWLATAYEVNADATVFTFDLKEGVTFSDGTPFDATVVKKNLDYVKDVLKGKAARGSGYLRHYTSTTVLSPAKVEVRFSKPSIQFLTGAATPALAMTSASSVQLSAAERCSGEYIGTGPFVLETDEPNQHITLTKRKGYTSWSSLAQHDGDAYLDKVEFRIMPVPSLRAGSLNSGQVDVATALAAQDLPGLEAAGRTTISQTQPGIPVSFMVNSTRPNLQDPAVRRALSLSMDRKTVVSTLLGDTASVAKGPLTESVVGFEDLSSELTFDPDGASKSLDEAGWLPGDDGVRMKDGERLSVSIIYTSDIGEFYTSFLQAFQQDWKKLGIEVKLSNITLASLADAFLSHDYDMWVGSVTEVDPDVLANFVGGYHADQATLERNGITEVFSPGLSSATSL